MEKQNKNQRKTKTEKVIGQNGQPDRIVFSNSSRVNIGDYEHRELFVSHASDLNEGETFDDAYARVSKPILKKVYAFEKKHRMKAREFVDFDTKAKL